MIHLKVLILWRKLADYFRKILIQFDIIHNALFYNFSSTWEKLVLTKIALKKLWHLLSRFTSFSWNWVEKKKYNSINLLWKNGLFLKDPSLFIDGTAKCRSESLVFIFVFLDTLFCFHEKSFLVKSHDSLSKKQLALFSFFEVYYWFQERPATKVVTCRAAFT